MNITINQILSAKPVLDNIAMKDMPFGMAYQMTKNFEEINNVIKMFEDKRGEIIARFGEEKDGAMTVSAENQPAAEKEIMDLVNEELDITLNTLSIADMEKADLVIKPAELAAIDWLVDA